MKAVLVLAASFLVVVGACSLPRSQDVFCAYPGEGSAQAPDWSADDAQFFLHGSMSTEVVPEDLLRTFIRIYPELFPTQDLSHLGLIPDARFGWPIGISRARPEHLGGLSSVGINCASCHVGDVDTAAGRVRVLGMTSHFDVEGFFGTVLITTYRAADPAEMSRFLAEYLVLTEGDADRRPAADRRTELEALMASQKGEIADAMSRFSTAAPPPGPGGLYELSPSMFRSRDRRRAGEPQLANVAVAMLMLFHNMRAALHVPDHPLTPAPPASGPGRNDAFGLLSAGLFGKPLPYGPVKFGLVWNVSERHWVHWDANTQSPISRNLLASLGLGAPLIGHHAVLDFAKIQRLTDLSEHIAPPRYPLTIDHAAAARGESLFKANCASCHTGPESDARLFAASVVGTDPVRAGTVTPDQSKLFNEFVGGLETAGYHPSPEPGTRSTQKYWASDLAGVWARSPYLHNGSVRTMEELLAPPVWRRTTFHRGSRVFDDRTMGYTDAGPYLFDTTRPGNSNSGHDYGTSLTPAQKRDLIEYLKTL